MASEGKEIRQWRRRNRHRQKERIADDHFQVLLLTALGGRLRKSGIYPAKGLLFYHGQRQYKLLGSPDERGTHQ